MLEPEILFVGQWQQKNTLFDRIPGDFTETAVKTP